MILSPLQRYFDAHKLTLISTPEKGRSVIATGHHRRGAVVITSQPLAIAAVSDDYCQHCFRQSRRHTALQRCSKCKTAYFCGMDCFKSAWVNYHRHVCGDKDHRTFDEELLERAVCSIIRYRQQHTLSRNVDNNMHSDNGIIETSDTTMEAFSHLEHHLDEQPMHIKEQLSELAHKILQRPYLQQQAAQYGISHDYLIRLQSQFQCNAMSIQDEHLFVVGEGLYPVASFFNHSCRPNAAAVFDGSFLMVKAIEPIIPGEEITLAYIDIGRSRGYRQRNLRDRYFFTCDCVRCSDHGWLRVLDRMVGDDEDDEYEDISTVSYNNTYRNSGKRKKIDQLETLRQHIEHWDLLTLSRQYDRLKNIHPDPSQPLTLGTFTHHMLQLFTPYIWSVSNPDLQYTSRQWSQSANASATTAESPSSFPVSPPLSVSSILSSSATSSSPPSSYMEQQFYAEFDDPCPRTAQPRVQQSYQAILTKAIETCLSFPMNCTSKSSQPSATISTSSMSSSPTTSSPISPILHSSPSPIIPATSSTVEGMLPIPVFRISILTGVQHLFYEAVANKHWPFAVKCGLYILIQYCFLYPPYHPTMAHHLAMLAKTGWNFIVQDRIEEKVYARGLRRWIALAKETAKHAFGIHGWHYKEAVNLECLFRREQQLIG